MTETPPPTSLKRRSGKPVAIGMLVLILGGVAFALSMWFWGREPHGPIETIAAVDDTHVAVLRKGFEERGYTHVGVWTAEGDMLWSEALFGVQDDPGLSVSDELVLVLVTEARGNPALHAFDRETGEFRWKVEQDPAGEASSWRSALQVGETVAWLMGPGRKIQIVDLSTGEVRATVEPEAPSDSLYEQADGDRLVLVGLGGAVGYVGTEGVLEDGSDPPPQGVPMLRDGERLCVGHPATRCRRIAGLGGYARGDDVVWIHGETELGRLKADDLDRLDGPFEVGELTDR